MSTPEPLCMICNRIPATVTCGKARYCSSCANTDPAFFDLGVTYDELSGETMKKEAEIHRRRKGKQASQRNQPGGWWNNKER